jgi:hypothetical protein
VGAKVGEDPVLEGRLPSPRTLKIPTEPKAWKDMGWTHFLCLSPSASRGPNCPGWGGSQWPQPSAHWTQERGQRPGPSGARWPVLGEVPVLSLVLRLPRRGGLGHAALLVNGQVKPGAPLKLTALQGPFLCSEE